MNNKKLSKQYILAIETSCDDTSVAIYNNNKWDMITYSSAKEQSHFGGVVPELAARKHEENLLKATKQLLWQNNLTFDDIESIAYTNEPGLKVCLNMGKIFATTLAYLYDKKIQPINHLYAHLFSFALTEQIEFPFIGLVASGGHTSLYLVNDFNDIKVINETIDDAVGEVYDKIGKKMHIPYPCGPYIDANYDANKTTINFLSKKIKPENTFSFSGIKSQVINYIDKNKNQDRTEILSSFQKLIIDILVDKIIFNMQEYKVKNLVIGGGVCANQLLRSELNKLDYNVKLPIKEICGDNALMIALMATLLQ